jgi:hypothetical protein
MNKKFKLSSELDCGSHLEAYDLVNFKFISFIQIFNRKFQKTNQQLGSNIDLTKNESKEVFLIL